MESITPTQLPTEMLELILQGISTTELLNNCRMVSHQWNQVAAYVSRNRYNSVRIHATELYANLDPEYITQIFPYKDNLPWSAVHMYLSDGNHGSAVNRHIVESFGSYIKMLIVSMDVYNYDTLIYLLKKMPNLEMLQLKPLRNLVPRMPLQEILSKGCLPPTGVVRLPMLKIFDFTVGNKYENNFVEFIITKVGCSLKNVNISILDYVTVPKEFQNFQKLLQLLNQTDVSVSLHFNHMQYSQSCGAIIIQKIDCNLRSLEISLSSLSLEAKLRVLEDSLSKCRRLATLRLHFSCSKRYSGGISRRFSMPELPQLEVLELFTQCMGKQTHEILPFNPINPASLPHLRKVSIMSNKVGQDLEDFKPIFQNSDAQKFVTVTELIANTGNDIITWTIIFPHLINLQLTSISRSTDLEHIFHCMPNLKYLSISLSALEMDVNLALANCFRNPICLNRLRTLRIKDIITAEQDWNWRLSDSGAILLRLLPPLNLKISCDCLSYDCISKLRSHHNFVELLN